MVWIVIIEFCVGFVKCEMCVHEKIAINFNIPFFMRLQKKSVLNRVIYMQYNRIMYSI